MFQFAVMLTEGFTTLGCVSELAELRGQKAESDRQNGTLPSEKITGQQTTGENNDIQPTLEKKHPAIKIVMLPRAPRFSRIPDMVDETRTEFVIGTFHVAISTNKTT